MESWRVSAPGTVEAIGRGRADGRRSTARRLDLLLGAGLLVVEAAWVAVLVWALSLAF